MNLLLKVNLCLIILFSLNELKGQTDFRPGFVITNNNDTLRGLIDYRGDIRNAKRCDYKENETSVVKEFKPFDIKGYRFTDSKFYISKSVNINSEEIKVFLEFLVEGIANLYYYPEDHNPQYFIEKTSGQLIELTNEQVRGVVDGKEYLHDSKKYVGLLKYTFADCPQIFPLIDKTKLDNKSLIEVAKKYHEYVCNYMQCVIYEKKIPAIRVTIAPYLSINSSQLTLKNIRIENVHFKTTYWPSIGLQLNTQLSRVNEKLSFYVSGELGKSDFYGTGGSPFINAIEKVQIHLVTLGSNVGFKYTYPKSKFKPTIMLGASFLYLVSKDGRRVEEIPGVYTRDHNEVMNDKLMLGYALKLGIDYHSAMSVIPFLSLGFNNIFGKDNYNVQIPFTTNIGTISLNGGIYFK